jgi:hypothetical protein
MVVTGYFAAARRVKSFFDAYLTDASGKVSRIQVKRAVSRIFTILFRHLGAGKPLYKSVLLM